MLEIRISRVTQIPKSDDSDVRMTLNADNFQKKFGLTPRLWGIHKDYYYKIEYSLFEHGNQIDNIYIKKYGNRDLFTLHSTTRESNTVIQKYSIKEISSIKIKEIFFDLEIEDVAFLKGLPIQKNKDDILSKAVYIQIWGFDKNSNEIIDPQINIFNKISLYQWQKPYTISEFQNEILRHVDKYSSNELIFKKQNLGLFSFVSINTENPIKTEINKCSEIVRLIHQKALLNLESKLPLNSITIPFNDFPQNVRIACEQYLQYFAEFLRDLGVNATSDLKHEAGKVLFTITPDDKKVSLDKIRAALEVYLELPKSPLIDADNPNNGIREIKYIQEVNTLKTRLTQAEIQIHYEKQISAEKERTIQALSILTKSIIEEKINTSSKEAIKDEKKKLLKGTVEVGKLKVFEGIEIDIPRFLENTKLDAVFDQLEEYLNSEHITQLKLNEPSEDSK